MRRWVLVGLLAVLLVAAGFGGVASGDGGDLGTASDASTGPVSLASVQDESNEQEFNRTYFDVTVYENGSATWTFRYERSLDDDEIDAFESFADEFESEETARYRQFVVQAENLTATGTEHTGREMEATNFERSARVTYGIGTDGVVEMTFLWDGFATTDDQSGTVTAGDALGDSLYLASDQRMIIHPDDGLAFQTARPEGEYSTVSLSNADSMTWVGEQEVDQPRIVFETESDETAGWLTGGDVVPWQVGAVLGVGAVLAGAVVWWRRGADADEPDDANDDESTPTADTPPPADEFVSDEEIVVEIIRENGGRMKQVDIVAETDWSKSKVSMLLSEMEEAGTISKLRVGRENIVSLDGYEPEATKSPFDE